MVAVIGDIHGCYFTLVNLCNRIREEHSNIPIYCVGDLVDRGNNSFEVINYIMDQEIKFTPGNHDYMFYYFFKHPASIFARSWVFNGSESTLKSYENREESIFKHIEFIKSFPLYYDLDDCFISHAGISDKYKKTLPEDFRKDLSALNDIIYNDYDSERGVLWTRDNLLNLGKLQLLGHTKQKEVNVDEHSNAAYIDTGACLGNKLSAVIVEKSKIISTIEEKTDVQDIL